MSVSQSLARTVAHIGRWVAASQVVLFCSFGYCQSVTAWVFAASSQFATPSTATFSGDVADFLPLSVASSPQVDPIRYSVAQSSLRGGAYAYSFAHGSGISSPSAAANFDGYQVTFENTPSLQAAISENSGQPLQFYILFASEFSFQNPRNPSTGTFNQTTTSSSASVTTKGLLSATIAGSLSSQNGPYDQYSLTTSGFLTDENLNSGAFAVKVPFSVSLSSLSTTFSVYAGSSSLSLDMEALSSAGVFLPPRVDVYFSDGSTASAAGLTYQVTSVPEPATLLMHIAGLSGLLWRLRLTGRERTSRSVGEA